MSKDVAVSSSPPGPGPVVMSLKRIARALVSMYADQRSIHAYMRERDAMVQRHDYNGGPEPEPCARCRFWDGHVCRRYAPQRVGSERMGWPNTMARDWCGDFMPLRGMPGPGPVSAEALRREADRLDALADLRLMTRLGAAGRVFKVRDCRPEAFLAYAGEAETPEAQFGAPATRRLDVLLREADVLSVGDGDPPMETRRIKDEAWNSAVGDLRVQAGLQRAEGPA